MSRHIIDQTRQSDATDCAAQYARIARAAGPNKASLQLQRRPVGPASGRRLMEFLRIARGRRA
ncbi:MULTISPECIES: hypothetical protein [Actibacterium]|uniref:Uncharacterized protein n=1 Tax=Actibacterium naphthalenivorans TaxID=1614693 RepID=A0A840CBS9_9RHOB|nr:MULTISPECIES: hypothetical protein [Actibacterium]ALG88943.1 hypothetical protein TQ29_00665 [Actibacterium sp. EMB200-NS6]MBB4021522.1 hypothetical protein [Actibacterium naphthalenivorans]